MARHPIQVVRVTRALAVELDGALGDTRPLWQDWLGSAASVLDVDPDSLSSDRGEAAATLDAAGAGNWRVLLARFAEERAPVYLRPQADVSTALRRLEAERVAVGVFTDAPLELARVVLAQLGAARRIVALEAGAGALPRLRGRLGDDSVVIRSRQQLVARAAASEDSIRPA